MARSKCKPYKHADLRKAIKTVGSEISNAQSQQERAFHIRKPISFNHKSCRRGYFKELVGLRRRSLSMLSIFSPRKRPCYQGTEDNTLKYFLKGATPNMEARSYWV